MKDTHDKEAAAAAAATAPPPSTTSRGRPSPTASSLWTTKAFTTLSSPPSSSSALDAGLSFSATGTGGAAAYGVGRTRAVPGMAGAAATPAPLADSPNRTVLRSGDARSQLLAIGAAGVSTTTATSTATTTSGGGLSASQGGA